MKLTKAKAEIDSLLRSFREGDYTAIELAIALESAIGRHGKKTEVIKRLPNGVCLVRITDGDGETVAEYHSMIMEAK